MCPNDMRVIPAYDKLLSENTLSCEIVVCWGKHLPPHPALCSWNLGCSLGASYHSHYHSIM